MPSGGVTSQLQSSVPRAPGGVKTDLPMESVVTDEAREPIHDASSGRSMKTVAGPQPMSERSTGTLTPPAVRPARTAAATALPLRKVSPPTIRPMTVAIRRTTAVCTVRKGAGPCGVGAGELTISPRRLLMYSPAHKCRPGSRPTARFPAYASRKKSWKSPWGSREERTYKGSSRLRPRRPGSLRVGWRG